MGGKLNPRLHEIVQLCISIVTCISPITKFITLYCNCVFTYMHSPLDFKPLEAGTGLACLSVYVQILARIIKYWTREQH